jgi:hypothetical protein
VALARGADTNAARRLAAEVAGAVEVRFGDG